MMITKVIIKTLITLSKMVWDATYPILKTFATPALFVSGLSITIVREFFEKDLHLNWSLSITLIIFLCADSILGFIKHWKAKTISEEGWSKLLIKIIVGGIFITVVSRVSQLKIPIYQTEIQLKDYSIDNLLMCAPILTELISVLKHIGYLAPGWVPKSVLKRLEYFNDKGIPTMVEDIKKTQKIN
jgi:hypothetical protein